MLNWLRTRGIRELAWWVAGVVIAVVIWRLWCLVRPSTEAVQILMTVVAGGGGMCIAGPNFRGQRLISNGLVGTLVALLFYCGVRGVLVRAVAPASSVQACGAAAMIFLTAASRPDLASRGVVNRMAGKAAICLAGLFGLWGGYSAVVSLRRVID